MNERSISDCPPPRFLDAGEMALVVEFGDAADPAVNDRVLALDHALGACRPPGVVELVPTYRSLMIHYDPLVIDRTALVAHVETLIAAGLKRTPTGNAHWVIPCCYDPACAEDLPETAARLGLSTERVAELHCAATYRIAMYGFAPGFTYLFGLPPKLALSRRLSPRPPHPSNAVIVGGGLCSIASLPMPTGWWVIGRTPEHIFSPDRDPAFLVAVGDSIAFEPVDRATFDLLEERAAAGEIIARREQGR